MSRTLLRDFLLEVGKGKITGHRLIHKFGRNSNAASGVWEDIWTSGGTRTHLTVAATLEAVSTSANDAAAGTGARKVMIFGLDANFDEINEEVTMNGVSATTATTASFIRVYRAFVTESGVYSQTTAGANEGQITIRVSGAGVTQGFIDIEASNGFGQTQMSHYTVPSGFVAFMYSIHLSVDSGKAANILLIKRVDADIVAAPFTSKRGANRFDGVTGQSDESPKSPVVFDEKTDIWFAVLAAQNNTEVEVDYELVLIDKTLVGTLPAFL